MGIAALWMPILVSAVLVFIASAIIWTILPWHKSDFKKTSDEEAVRAALRGSAPGYYMLPHCTDPAELKNPDVAHKYVEGPQGYITIIPNGMPAMGSKLVMSFLNNLFVGSLCAYFVSSMAAPDADYLAIFRIAGATCFTAYGIAYFQDSVWFGRPWSITARNLVDALLYGMLTGGAFGWLA